MTAIDTTTWLSNSNIHQNTTSALNQYVNNGTNQYTLNETTARQFVGNHRERSCGIRVINHPNTTAGTGKSVRPPQRFTRALTGGGHVHFVPNVELIRLYGSINEGGSGIATPTGVIGVGIETLRLSSVAPENDFPTANDAEIEIDIAIFDKEDSSKYAVLTNYPISTTGLGTSWTTSNSGSVLWRGALGVSLFDRSYIVHNTQSGAWLFHDWSLNEMWNDTGRWIVSYRLHDVVAPYSIANEVNTGVAINPGVYASVPDIDLSVGGSNTLTLSGGGEIEASGATQTASVVGGGTLSFSEELAMLRQDPALRGLGNLLQLSGGGEIQARDASVSLEGVARLRLDGGGSLGSASTQVMLSGGNTIEGLSIELVSGVLGNILGNEPRGFIPTVIYWYRR